MLFHFCLLICVWGCFERNVPVRRPRKLRCSTPSSLRKKAATAHAGPRSSKNAKKTPTALTDSIVQLATKREDWVSAKVGSVPSWAFSRRHSHPAFCNYLHFVSHWTWRIFLLSFPLSMSWLSCLVFHVFPVSPLSVLVYLKLSVKAVVYKIIGLYEQSRAFRFHLF